MKRPRERIRRARDKRRRRTLRWHMCVLKMMPIFLDQIETQINRGPELANILRLVDVTAPDLSVVSAQDRANRVLPGVMFTIEES